MMTNINDYKDLKKGDLIIHIRDSKRKDVLRIDGIEFLTDYDPDRSSNVKIICNYFHVNPEIESMFPKHFLLKSAYSKSTFMYFRDKNINELLND